MATKPLLAGVDVGTTNIKAVIFTPTGRVVAQASVPTPTYYPRPKWAYYKPEELWQSTAAALRLATGQLDNPGQIAAIAIASMGETAIPLDAHDQPTYQAIAWFDQRTQPQVDWLEHTIGKDRLFASSGLSLQPIFGLCKLLWFKENQPDAFAKTVHWLNVADYIAYRLCGVPATDYSLASRTLALQLHQLQWNEPLINEVGLSPNLFAPLLPGGTRLGAVTANAASVTGLPTSAQVSTGGHDDVCGTLAAGVVNPGAMLNSMGTSEGIFLPTEQPIADANLGRQGYTQGAHAAPGHYYVSGGSYTSGASVEWWREILGQNADYATLIAEAEQVPAGSLGVYFLSHLRLANPPNDDPKGRGAFIGLSTDAKRGTLFRAILEGLAFESRYALEGLLEYPQIVAPRQIYAVGGNTRNHLLMQIKASVLNKPITVVEVTEAVSLGAAILAGLGAGVYADVPSALAAIHYTQTSIEPDAALADLYNNNYRQVYQQIYSTLRPLNHSIDQMQNAYTAPKK